MDDRTRPGDVFNCAYCGNEKEATRYDQKYCSKACGNRDNGAEDRRGTTGECKTCGEQFERSRDQQRYCSNSCALKHQYETGERDKEIQTEKANKALREQGMEKFRENPTINRGKRGYKRIYIPSAHPDLPQGWLKLHHYVWWKNKGELPPTDEYTHLHHVDGDKDNNNIENLELISNSEHLKKHWEDWYKG